MSLTSRDVTARYDELAELVVDVERRGPGDVALVAEAATLVAHEARLLAARRYDEWLAGWSDDAVLWVPMVPTHPAADQSLLLDDRRRLAERVRWRAEPSAWGQQPPSRTTRVVGSVEAWRSGDRVIVRSGLVLHEHRRARAQLLVGHQIHEFVDEASRCRTKILLLPQLSLGIRNPSFLL